MLHVLVVLYFSKYIFCFFVSFSYKVVETVPNNMCFLVMDKLEPDTAYQVAVSSIAGRNRKRSGYVFFRTFSKPLQPYLLSLYSFFSYAETHFRSLCFCMTMLHVALHDAANLRSKISSNFEILLSLC